MPSRGSAETTSESSDDSLKKIKGQALFLRAFSYFELVRLFGHAPLHLVPVSTREEAALPLSDAAALYAQVKLDAEAAIQLLPPKSVQEAGRVTSGAARMLLADAYMNQGNWLFCTWPIPCHIF